MLEEISITNLGIIQKATLPFTEGLTVITGETGAGKTMVLTALSLLLGKRSDSSIVRQGVEFTSVQGCWNVQGLPIVPAIEETGAVLEDGQLFLNRTIYANGKSRAVAGGKTTPASVLATIGEGLVSIHGQSDQIRLKNNIAQREALDSFAGQALAVSLKEYRTTYKEWIKVSRLIKDLKVNASNRQREWEELTQNLEELERINPQKGEDEILKQEAETLSNIDLLKKAAEEAYAFLQNEDYETTDLLSQITEITKILTSVSRYDPTLEEFSNQAETIKILTNELATNIGEYVNNIDINSLERLDQVQARRAELARLTRKYGVHLDDVLSYWENTQTRIQEINPENNNIEKLEGEFTQLENLLHEQIKTVTNIRKEQAGLLEEEVNKELAGLAMAGNKLVITITQSNGPTITGQDEISFMLQTPGTTEPRPINKSASGGELSRIMLALEVVLANPETTPTFIFDEVDSGVGGATAIEIGKRLATLAKEAQVIVVTHLPQVAAFADNHLQVTKTATNDHIETSVTQLSATERTEELARMLSGLSTSESGQAHAQELIELAEKYKQ